MIKIEDIQEFLNGIKSKPKQEYMDLIEDYFKDKYVLHFINPEEEKPQEFYRYIVVHNDGELQYTPAYRLPHNETWYSIETEKPLEGTVKFFYQQPEAKKIKEKTEVKSKPKRKIRTPKTKKKIKFIK